MSNTALFVSLVILIIISAFFSAAETALMAVNRYRLRHLAKSNHRTAQLVSRLLERPDRLLSVILLGNTFANIMASAIATLLANHFFGEIGAFACAIVLTFVMLIFAEVTPKTLAAIRPLLISLYVVWPLFIFKKILSPLVWSVNQIALFMLRSVGVKVKHQYSEALNMDELRTLLHETGDKIPHQNKQMLLAILDLTKATVEDVMVPKHDVVGVNLNHPWEEIVVQLTKSPYMRLPVFKGSLEHLQGILPLREALHLISQSSFNKFTLLGICKKTYYVPATTPLGVQLANFQKTKQRMALVVDEYGDLLGLVTLEDILEEIVGEFKLNAVAEVNLIHAQADGSYIVEGSITLRDLNRELELNLPTDLAKTLSGAIIEYLEMIPTEQMCLLLSGYPIEILKVNDNTIKKVRIRKHP